MTSVCVVVNVNDPAMSVLAHALAGYVLDVTVGAGGAVFTMVNLV